MTSLGVILGALGGFGGFWGFLGGFGGFWGVLGGFGAEGAENFENWLLSKRSFFGFRESWVGGPADPPPPAPRPGGWVPGPDPRVLKKGPLVIPASYPPAVGQTG